MSGEQEHNPQTTHFSATLSHNGAITLALHSTSMEVMTNLAFRPAIRNNHDASNQLYLVTQDWRTGPHSTHSAWAQAHFHTSRGLIPTRTQINYSPSEADARH